MAAAPIFDPIVQLPDLVQGGDASGVHDSRQLTELLGDPEAHVGRPADDGGAGVACAQRRECIFAGGCGEERSVVAGEEIGIVTEPGELPGGLGGALREGVVGLSRTALGARHPRWAGSRCNGTDCPRAQSFTVARFACIPTW